MSGNEQSYLEAKLEDLYDRYYRELSVLSTSHPSCTPHLVSSITEIQSEIDTILMKLGDISEAETLDIAEELETISL